MRIFLRVSSALIIAFLLLAPRQGLGDTILATESFSQTAGPLHNTNGGSGWAAPWQVQNNSTKVPGYNIATAVPLSYPGVSSTGGYAVGGDSWQYAGRLLDTSSGGAFAPYLANQLIGNPGTTLFFGLLMRKDVDTDDEMSVTLHAGNPPWWVNAPGISIGHFGSASNTGGTRYWSLRLDGIVYQTTVPVVVGQSAFLVVQITFGATSTISLYANPPVGAPPRPTGCPGRHDKLHRFSKPRFLWWLGRQPKLHRRTALRLGLWSAGRRELAAARRAIGVARRTR